MGTKLRLLDGLYGRLVTCYLQGHLPGHVYIILPCTSIMYGRI